MQLVDNLIKTKKNQSLTTIHSKSVPKKLNAVSLEFPKITNDDPIVNSIADLCRECQCDFKLNKDDIYSVVDRVNRKGHGEWSWYQLG